MREALQNDSESSNALTLDVVIIIFLTEKYQCAAVKDIINPWQQWCSTPSHFNIRNTHTYINPSAININLFIPPFLLKLYVLQLCYCVCEQNRLR